MTSRSSARALATRVATLLLASLGLGIRLPAQMLGVPVLQNGFMVRGVAVAGNYGSADGGTAFGIAGSTSPLGSRFMLSGGVGTFSPRPRDVLGNELTYGARIAIPVLRLMGGAVGIAPFAGVGGASLDARAGAGAAADSGDTKLKLLHAPVGVAVGYRRALGATRGISVYAAPFYSWNRSTFGDSSTSRGVLRVSVGLDVGLVQSIGLTLGYETGASAGDAEPGPRTGVFGAGLSYAFGARR
jgi:hypothetical protein